MLMEEAERLLPSYCKMAESLWLGLKQYRSHFIELIKKIFSCGESLYELQTAKDLRVKVIKLQEQIDYTR